MSNPVPTDDPRCLIAGLRHWARTAEDAPFFTFQALDGSRDQLGYGAFYDRVRRLAGALLDAGLRPGDRWVLHMGNTPGFMVAFWALQEAGGVPVPTIVQYSAQELRYVVEHAEARGVITTDELVGAAAAATEGRDTVLVVEGARAGGDALALDELLAAGNPTDAPRSAPSDLALIMYTSGTTSRPKGVMLGQDGAAYTGACYAQHLRLLPRDTVLTCMPLFHVNGMFLQMVPAVLSGSQLVLTPGFSASRFWGWVTDHRVTVAHLISGLIRVLLAGDPAAGDRRHEVRAMTFGLPLGDGEIAAFEQRFGIPLVMVWGLTESCCGGTLMPLGFARRPGQQHIGPAMIGWEVRAVDDELREVADGEPGELVVRSPGVMRGYYRDPEATAATLVDGWVRSGDIGYRDAIGHFHFVDRLKDMLKPSGENVAASEIERVIEAHPATAECAVIGIPDAVRNETVIALVVPRPGATVTAEEIRAHCAEHLARFKVPSIVELRDELPKTSIGKIRKGELRQSLADH